MSLYTDRNEVMHCDMLTQDRAKFVFFIFPWILSPVRDLSKHSNLVSLYNHFLKIVKKNYQVNKLTDIELKKPIFFKTAF